MEQKELNKRLLDASSEGNLEKVKESLEKGADIEARDHTGWNALHFASFQDRLKTVKYLIEKGADIEARDVTGWTALHYASAYGTLETVKYLLGKGAAINEKNDRGWTALHYASIYDRLNIVKYLVEKGAEIDLDTLEKYPELVFKELQKRMGAEDKWTSVVMYFLQKQNIFSKEDFLKIIKTLLEQKEIPDNLRLLLSAFLP